MNALCGTFLYVLPEVDAFFAFSTFILENFYLYVVPTIDGVHSGLKLLDRILSYLCFMRVRRKFEIKIRGGASKAYKEIFYFDWERHVDPELFKYLHAHNYYPELLTHAVLSLGTGTPPLDEVLHLWDFYFAFGLRIPRNSYKLIFLIITDMNIVCTVAQLVLMRETLLAHPSPSSQLRNLPPLHAQSIITLAVQLVRQLPSDLYDMLALHPTQSVQIPK